MVAEATTIVDITDKIIPRTGFTKSGSSHVFRQGKHVFGTLVILKSSGYFVTSGADTIADIDISVAPGYQYLTMGGFSDDIWKLTSVGYAFIQGSSASSTDEPGKVVVTATGASDNKVKIQLDYVIA